MDRGHSLRVQLLLRHAPVFLLVVPAEAATSPEYLVPVAEASGCRSRG